MSWRAPGQPAVLCGRRADADRIFESAIPSGMSEEGQSWTIGGGATPGRLQAL